MIPSMASVTSSSSATVRVEKATSEFLIGPDWTLNMEICDVVNSNQLLAKDVVKAVKKRLQHKNPKVQLLALTLLETMVKNCADYVHFQIAEKNILQEMVKIIKKKSDMHVRDKVLTLIGSWHEAFGGPGGRYPQYYMAYEDLRRLGVQFPQRPADAAPIFTPPATHAVPQIVYGVPSSSATRLDEAMAAEDSLSSSSLNSMRSVLELLTDMLQAVDPSNPSAVKDELIVDLVEQCRVNQRKLMQLLAKTGVEELLCEGLELNDSLQNALAKHDAIASGSPLPLELTPPEKNESDLKSPEASTSNETTPAPLFPAHADVADDDEDDEEDDFAQLARRHSKAQSDVSQNTPTARSDVAPSEASTSNALVPVDAVETKDQNIIELLSIVLSTDASTEQTSENHAASSSSPGIEFSPEAYPDSNGVASNGYVAPWAHTQPENQPNPPQYYQQPQNQPNPPQHYPNPPQHYQQPQNQPQYAYPPPPWAATPGYFSSAQPMNTYSTPAPTSSSNGYEFTNGELEANSSTSSTTVNAGQKPFIPSYRLFEDLDVFGNATPANNVSGSNNHSMVGGRK